MIKKWCIQNKYSIFIILLLTGFCGYFVSQSYGFLLYPDEFGYWTYAAMLAGYDWSDVVSLGSYYSYGYSLILFPIFALCKNAVIAYRVAIAANFILLVICFLMWKKLAEKLFGEEKKETCTFYAAIAVFYPSLLFYARTTLAEIVIVTLYAAICMLFYHYLEYNKKSTLIMLVLALVYIHFIHMRTIAILIAGGMTLTGYYLVKKKKLKQTLLMIAALFAAFCVGICAKEWITGHLYAASDSVSANDYAGQLGKLAYIFTKKGMLNFAISIAGKLLYLGLASFGLAYFGIIYAIKQILKAVSDYKKGGEMNTAVWFHIFILLSVIGATLVNAVYTVSPGRVDALPYGRYHEYVVPVLMIFGIREVSRTAKLIHDCLILLGMETLMTGMVVWSLTMYGQTNIHGYMMVGMSYMHDLNHFEPIPFFWKALGLGIVLTIGVTLIIRLANRCRGMEVVMTLILILEFALMLRAGSLYLDNSARGAYRDTRIAERIEELEQEHTREIYYCLSDNSYELISIMQFMLRERDIQIIDRDMLSEDKIDSQAILLIDYRDPMKEALEEKYDKYLENGHFTMFYNK